MEESIELCWRKSSYSGNGGASCVEVASYRWRKSSYSGNGGSDCVEVASDHWQKSSYSGNGGGDCVEVASNLPSIVLVRDSKDREGSRLTVSDQAWSAFVQGIKHREFDR